MKTIIAESRNVVDQAIIEKAVLESAFLITEVVEGGLKGVDTLVRKWAEENQLPIKEFKAKWIKYGKSADPIRNRDMAEYADALISVWDSKSRGTKNITEIANKLKLKVFIYHLVKRKNN